MTTRSPLSLKVRLERITKGELEKVRRGLSWMVLVAAAAKVASSLSLVDQKSLSDIFPTVRAAEYFLILGGWPWWQFTLLGDAS